MTKKAQEHKKNNLVHGMCYKNNNREHGGAVASAVASQQ